MTHSHAQLLIFLIPMYLKTRRIKDTYKFIMTEKVVKYRRLFTYKSLHTFFIYVLLQLASDRRFTLYFNVTKRFLRMLQSLCPYLSVVLISTTHCLTIFLAYQENHYLYILQQEKGNVCNLHDYTHCKIICRR